MNEISKEERKKENFFKNFKEIKTFVMRSGRMTASQKKYYAEFSEKYCIPFSNNKIKVSEIFGNENPLIIEIGFGMGTATSQIAEENPDKNYIGIEVFRAGVGKLLGEIENKGLKNIRIIEHDAIEVLDKMIEDSSIDGFHIFFPDPWQKKRNHKRRLIRRPRTDLIASKMKKASYLYMVTDWEDYAEDAFEQLSETEGLKSKYERFADAQSWRPSTKFEQKGIKKNHKINELFFEKVV